MFRSDAARLKAPPIDGMEALVTGGVRVFAQRGRYQLYVFWDPDKATATKNVTVDGALTIHCVPNLRMCQ